MPIPPDIATWVYYTGIDPFTNKPVNAAKNLRDRNFQRAFMQFCKPENYFEVRDALIQAGRADLIGGCEGLIPPNPPKEAIEARRRTNVAARYDHYHSVPTTAAGEAPGECPSPPSAKSRGHRPGRKSQTRRNKPGRGPKPHDTGA